MAFAPPALRLALRGTRRSGGSVPFLVTARLAQTGVRALPLLVVSLTVAQLTFAVALAATEQEAAGSSGSVVRYAAELDSRREAPLPEGLVRLAVAASTLLLLLAVLGVVLATLTEAPARSASFGRLRALGLRDGDLRRVLAGELLARVALAALAGLALGVSAAHAVVGSLSLEQITGQTGTPALAVPWRTALVVAALVAAALLWPRWSGAGCAAGCSPSCCAADPNRRLRGPRRRRAGESETRRGSVGSRPAAWRGTLDVSTGLAAWPGASGPAR
ncbi:MAG: putative permease [Nocardioides sp.]|nr:putative permease [Nocardioides sp.]